MPDMQTVNCSVIQNEKKKKKKKLKQQLTWVQRKESLSQSDFRNLLEKKE